VARLYPQALGSLILKALIRFSIYSLGADPTENTAYNRTSIVTYVTVAAVTWLLPTVA
jgi:hypothetical protein